MRKRFFTILALSSLLSLSVCNTSCNKDDDEDPQTEQNDPSDENQEGENGQEDEGNKEDEQEDFDAKVAQQQAAAIADDIKKLIAADANNSSTNADVLDELLDEIKKVQDSNNNALKEEVAKQVAASTGINKEAASAILNGESPTSVKEAISNMPAEDKNAVLDNASSYVKGYSDAKDLANTYNILTNENASKEDKLEALDKLDSDIKRYQASTDPGYKEVYVQAAAAATGLSEMEAKLILDAENPKETIAAILDIENDNDPNKEELTTDKGQQDGKVAADFIKSIKGKKLMEISGSIPEFFVYRKNYLNGSDEYKDSFKQTLLKEGISPDIVATFDSDEELDVMQLANLLGVSFF